MTRPSVGNLIYDKMMSQFVTVVKVSEKFTYRDHLDVVVEDSFGNRYVTWRYKTLGGPLDQIVAAVDEGPAENPFDRIPE